ncbi:MAG TPA: bifunctional demethylmenaquinone methyltransferase/2-methoxy-6-polyprenyl-1,4-benzoquinol methylase UbiE [Phycisphaerae bacterium]|nr:bifunctional demethylmenaquinone methyltransferase/2-methoxy-6-polyprenyl-1,4-benzoquinol methylase UbiE [Phycisphaerae bacterium]
MAAPAPVSQPAPSAEAAWTDPLLANPHAVEDKAARVNKMFSAIAPSYDLNNRLHSLWMDQYWRNVAVKMAGVKAEDRIVDVACGTGDLTVKFAEEAFGFESPARAASVIGIDFTYEMLPLARNKWQRHNIVEHETRNPEENPGAAQFVQFLQGNAMALPLPDSSVDVLSIAFGIRNVADWGAAIDEFARVLRPGGRLIILEFSLPTNPWMCSLYNFYFRKIMPVTATLISRDKTGAYKYLPQSVNTFISREAMQERMRTAGFGDIVARPLTFGICVCYRGVRQ